MVRLFEGYHVTFVGVRVSDAEGARREIQRDDRHAGWNRGSARAAHAGRDVRRRGRHDEHDAEHPGPPAHRSSEAA